MLSSQEDSLRTNGEQPHGQHLFRPGVQFQFRFQGDLTFLSLMIIKQNDNVFDLTPNFLTVLAVYCLHTISFRGKSGQNEGARAPQDRMDIFMRRLEFVLIMSAMPGMLGWSKFLEALNRKVLSYPFDDNRCESIIDVNLMRTALK